MAITRLKTWVEDEELSADDLNGEFNNIVTTGDQLIGTPRSAAFDLNAQELILDADQDTAIVSDTDDRVDVKCGGTDLFRFDGTTASSVNGIDFVAAATGVDAAIQAGVGDATANLNLAPKSTGSVGANGLELSPLAFQFFS